MREVPGSNPGQAQIFEGMAGLNKILNYASSAESDSQHSYTEFLSLIIENT